MDRHEPEHVHAEPLQIIQPGRDRVEIARLGEIARKNFIHHRAPQPGRGFTGARRGRIRPGNDGGIKCQPAHQSRREQARPFILDWVHGFGGNELMLRRKSVPCFQVI